MTFYFIQTLTLTPPPPPPPPPEETHSVTSPSSWSPAIQDANSRHQQRRIM